ncbi:3-phosphoshikimate 1-carboxyvinyltransferase, partial [Bacteroidota bacterium]
RALCNEYFNINNISESDDSKILNKILNSNDNYFDVGHAGTAMRFLTAYLARIVGEWTLTGSERMKQRPVGPLVDALIELGADIKYLENVGCPPIRILGKNLSKSKIIIDAGISSQFISALLLIAPTLPHGLELSLKNNISSLPYIDMTLSLMSYFGVSSKWNGKTIIIEPQEYKGRDYEVESDWSAAAFWYSKVFLSKNADLLINGLKKNSIQGDSEIVEIYKQLGVNSEFIDNGLKLTKIEKIPDSFHYDLGDFPDLAQSLIVALTFKHVPFRITGLKSLHIKETDRILALKKELGKFGFVIEETSNGVLEWHGEISQESTMPGAFEVETYNDHRMAMAFAPIAMVRHRVIINNPSVVSKSYPEYWNELNTIGFEIK